MVEDVANQSLIDTALSQWRRRKWLLIVCFLSVFSLAVSVVMALPSLYRSSTTILFGQEGIAESLVKTGASNELEQRLGIIQQAVLSRTQLQDVIDTFDLYGSLKVKAPPQTVVERLRKDIRITQQASSKPQWGKESTYAITITYQGWDPELVARVANDLAARFKAENEKIRTGQAARTTEFIREQLAVAKEHFVAEEGRMNAFRNQHMGGLPEQQQTNLVTLQRLNAELQLNTDKQIKMLSMRDAVMYGMASGEKPPSAAGLTGSMRLERLQRELADLQTRYTDSHPGIISLKNEISKLAQELDKNGDAAGSVATAASFGRNPGDMDRELTALVKEEAKLRSAIAAVTRRIEGTPKVEQELKRLAYDYESAKDEYLSLQKMYQDALLAQSLETQQNQQVRVIEVAIPAAFPAAPNRFRLLFIGFVVAAGVAGVVLFLAEQLDQSFHATAEVRQFTNIPVLATVSTIETAGDRLRGSTRFGLASVIVIAGLVVITGLGYYVGQGAEQLVWAISS